jgi:hypothetical protein
MTSMHKLSTAIIGIAIVLTVATTVSVQPAFAVGGTCGSCAKVFAPGTESGTGGTIGGGHEPAKAFAPGQVSTGSASDVAPGHLKP